MFIKKKTKINLKHLNQMKKKLKYFSERKNDLACFNSIYKTVQK